MSATGSSSPPRTLDRTGIAARIPHHGRMCLLERLASWSSEAIHCVANDHRDPAHPLRTASGLLSVCAIEYAAQAMALHGALLAPAGQPAAGYIASVRAVRLFVDRLDHIGGPIDVRAERRAGNETQVAYDFTLHDAAGRPLAEGRATVVLNTPLAA